jgi:predicted CopG family antitoxin|tara:strand:- start:574 stop:717 length:144 start_codon:yes stop_codon:yes gene_type:complete
MSKRIRISDDLYEKLQKIVKGSDDENVSVLVEKKLQQLIDQSKPISK